MIFTGIAQSQSSNRQNVDMVGRILENELLLGE